MQQHPSTLSQSSLSRTTSRKIAILGRDGATDRYEHFLSENGFSFLTTLNPRDILACDGLILPGGGDVTPCFFGEKNNGSRQIDTELDILQFQALDLCILLQKPVLGICKGMQLINIAFGGTILQDMPTSDLHTIPGSDLYHSTRIAPGSLLAAFYPEYNLNRIIVNSAHHQCLHRIGNRLRVIQYCDEDNCPEAIVHEALPILGVQWHPERLDSAKTSLSGTPLLSHFAGG